jgi:hypothetical protein
MKFGRSFVPLVSTYALMNALFSGESCAAE